MDRAFMVVAKEIRTGQALIRITYLNYVVKRRIKPLQLVFLLVLPCNFQSTYEQRKVFL
jgi:hypothetical protein